MKDILEWIPTIITITGFIFGFGIFYNDTKNLNKDIDTLKDENKELREKINKIENDFSFLRGVMSSESKNLNILTESHSPRRLTKEGEKVLKDSGIEQIVNLRYDEILELVKEDKPLNSYQAQESVKKAVFTLSEDADIKNTIEEGAFQSGYSPVDVIIVGAIFIRDRVLKDLGFLVEDIDKHNPKK